MAARTCSAVSGVRSEMGSATWSATFARQPCRPDWATRTAFGMPGHCPVAARLTHVIPAADAGSAVRTMCPDARWRTMAPVKTSPASIALAVAAGLALAAPAAAKPVTYAGKTSGGTKITFKYAGGTARGVSTLLPVTCVATSGTPKAGMDLYAPPMAFAVGKGEQRASAGEQPTAMYSSPVTKNYRFTGKRKRSGTITGKLHMNFSYLTIGYDFSAIPWICQGDGTFTAKPVR